NLYPLSLHDALPISAPPLRKFARKCDDFVYSYSRSRQVLCHRPETHYRILLRLEINVFPPHLHATTSMNLQTNHAIRDFGRRVRSEEHTSELQSPCN